MPQLHGQLRRIATACKSLQGATEPANDGGWSEIVATLQEVAKGWAGLHDGEVRSVVAAELRGRVPADRDSGPWVRYLFEDHAIVASMRDGEEHFFRVSIDEKDGELEVGDPVEVEETFQPVTSTIVKSVPEERFVLGPVLQPDVADKQKDVMTAVEIEKAQRRWVQLGSQLEREHTGGELGDRVRVVETYIAPQDLEFPQDDGDPVKISKGTWMLGCHVPDDKLWADVKAGRLTGFSPRGIGVRRVLIENGDGRSATTAAAAE